ncbi:MAG: cation:proton antiporter regulatory subunit [Egibacteraceae bacterium]
MAGEVEETPLPGVGIRYSFTASSGVRVSVLHHHSGRHQLFVSDVDDPDAAHQVLAFDDDDSHVLAELLGAARVTREIDRLQQSVAGLSIEWLGIPDGSPAAQRSIGDLQIRSSTGVTVIAAMREGEALPVPGPDFSLQAGDTLVVMGRPEAIRSADALLRGG